MGFGIFFVTLYLNVYDKIRIDSTFLASAGLAAGICIASSANLMLANNICDMKADLKIGRHTVVSYLGLKKKFLALSWLLFIRISGYYPLFYLPSLTNLVLILELLVLPLLYIALKSIWQLHSKKISFPKILQTNIALAGAQILGLGLVIIFG